LCRAGRGDVEQFCKRVQPRQPLLARQIAERVGGALSEIEPEALERRMQAGVPDFVPCSSMTGPRAGLPVDGRSVRERLGV